MTIDTLYQQTIKVFPPADRLRLATMILGDIPPQSLVDYSDEWTDEDLADFSRQGWRRLDEMEAKEAFESGEPLIEANSDAAR